MTSDDITAAVGELGKSYCDLQAHLHMTWRKQAQRSTPGRTGKVPSPARCCATNPK
jgi:hypothetical protein